MPRKENQAKAIAAGLLVIGMQLASPAHAATEHWDYAVKLAEREDSGSVYARLRGRGASYLWLSCIRTASDGERASVLSVAATVAQKEFLGASNGKGRSTVYWFDDGTPEVAPWVYQDQYGQLTGMDQVGAFIDDLSTSQKLDVELSNYRFEPVRLSFTLDPARTKAITDRFKRDCEDLQRKQH